MLFNDLRAGDVTRHQIRRELYPAELQVRRFSKRPNEKSLSETRHANQQHVSLAQEAHEDVLDNGLLPDDDLSNLIAQAAKAVVKRVENLRSLCLLLDLGHQSLHPAIVGPARVARHARAGRRTHPRGADIPTPGALEPAFPVARLVRCVHSPCRALRYARARAVAVRRYGRPADHPPDLPSLPG